MRARSTCARLLGRADRLGVGLPALLPVLQGALGLLQHRRGVRLGLLCAAQLRGELRDLGAQRGELRLVARDVAGQFAQGALRVCARSAALAFAQLARVFDRLLGREMSAPTS